MHKYVLLLALSSSLCSPAFAGWDDDIAPNMIPGRYPLALQNAQDLARQYERQACGVDLRGSVDEVVRGLRELGGMNPADIEEGRVAARVAEIGEAVQLNEMILEMDHLRISLARGAAARPQDDRRQQQALARLEQERLDQERREQELQRVVEQERELERQRVAAARERQQREEEAARAAAPAPFGWDAVPPEDRDVAFAVGDTVRLLKKMLGVASGRCQGEGDETDFLTLDRLETFFRERVETLERVLGAAPRGAALRRNPTLQLHRETLDRFRRVCQDKFGPRADEMQQVFQEALRIIQDHPCGAYDTDEFRALRPRLEPFTQLWGELDEQAKVYFPQRGPTQDVWDLRMLLFPGLEVEGREAPAGPAPVEVIRLPAIWDILGQDVKAPTEEFQNTLDRSLDAVKRQDAAETIMALGDGAQAKRLFDLLTPALPLLMGAFKVGPVKMMGNEDELMAFFRELRRNPKFADIELPTDAQVRQTFTRQRTQYPHPYVHVGGRIPYQAHLEAWSYCRALFEKTQARPEWREPLSNMLFQGGALLSDQGTFCGAGLLGRTLQFYSNMITFLKQLEVEEMPRELPRRAAERREAPLVWPTLAVGVRAPAEDFLRDFEGRHQESEVRVRAQAQVQRQEQRDNLVFEALGAAEVGGPLFQTFEIEVWPKLKAALKLGDGPGTDVTVMKRFFQQVRRTPGFQTLRLPGDGDLDALFAHQFRTCSENRSEVAPAVGGRPAHYSAFLAWRKLDALFTRFKTRPEWREPLIELLNNGVALLMGERPEKSGNEFFGRTVAFYAQMVRFAQHLERVPE